MTPKELTICLIVYAFAWAAVFGGIEYFKGYKRLHPSSVEEIEQVIPFGNTNGYWVWVTNK